MLLVIRRSDDNSDVFITMLLVILFLVFFREVVNFVSFLLSLLFVFEHGSLIISSLLLNSCGFLADLGISFDIASQDHDLSFLVILVNNFAIWNSDFVIMSNNDLLVLLSVRWRLNSVSFRLLVLFGLFDSI